VIEKGGIRGIETLQRIEKRKMEKIQLSKELCVDVMSGGNRERKLPKGAMVG